MTNNGRQNRMSLMDWFGLSTGLIGLIANFVTIASLFRPDGSYVVTPTAIFLITPTIILYTTIVLSFYFRRIAVSRFRETYESISYEMFDVIENGGKTSAKAIGTPLLLVYGISLILHLFRFSEEPVMTGIYIVAFICFGGIGSLWLTDLLGVIAGNIYFALDPTYFVTDGKKKPQKDK